MPPRIGDRKNDFTHPFGADGLVQRHNTPSFRPLDRAWNRRQRLDNHPVRMPSLAGIDSEPFAGVARRDDGPARTRSDRRPQEQGTGFQGDAALRSSHFEPRILVTRHRDDGTVRDRLPSSVGHIAVEVACHQSEVHAAELGDLTP